MTGSDHGGRRADQAGVRWRVTTPSGDQFACRVRATGTRVEVRLTTGQDDVVCVRDVPSYDEARAVVNRWLRAVIAGGQRGDTAAGPSTHVVH